ncbi:hypothetical protein FLGSB24_02460 [Flavobacterium sp. GSB-24]|nr:hypothetical protein FLGSB24_02460 [Flavobacterium sp. GSB-24]
MSSLVESVVDSDEAVVDEADLHAKNIVAIKQMNITFFILYILFKLILTSLTIIIPQIYDS